MSGQPSAFVERFLLPVLQSRELLVEPPLQREEYEALLRELETLPGTYGPVEVELQRRARELLHPAPLMCFDAVSLRLFVALHQLLFAVHASTERGRVSRGRLAVLAADSSRLIAQIPPPMSVESLVKHHLIVEPLLRIYREDTKVFFVAGSKAFYGEPIRWWRLPFRWNVQAEQSVGADVLVQLSSGPMALPMRTLLKRSPLTQLLRADRLMKALSFEGLDVIFENQTLCRYAVHALVDRGIAQAMPALAHAFIALAERVVEERNEAALQRLQKTLVLSSQFLLTLAVAHEFWRREDPQPLRVQYLPPTSKLTFEPPPMSAEEAKQGKTDGAQRLQLAKDGWAIIARLLARAEHLGMPKADRPQTALLKQRIAQLSGQLGDSISSMETLLGRALPS